MPIYQYKCLQCDKLENKVNTMDNHLVGPECCNTVMQQIIEAPMVNPIILGGGTYQGYKCPVTNEYVTSRKRRNEIMKENNLVPVGGSDGTRPSKEQ